MSTETLHIANTIKSQIGINCLMCIGAHKFVALPESDKNLGGLAFKVSANPKLRGGGYVTIELNALDLYDVTIKNNRGRVLKQFKDIYCDSLGGPDGVIESVTG